ncbi:hypothetical protein BC332_34045 [Capsicum chinense]|nr:hypothetical protein BC332_34045 [Capsicum chinense]
MPNKKSPSFEGHTIINLSCNIVFCILSRLSVKSLLRFQSVSKSWNVIIFDEVFKKAHHDQSKASSSKKHLLLKLDEDLFEFRDLENPKIAMGKQHFPLKEFRNPKVVCSCDFLVLMKKPMDDNKYVLWNPCANENQLFECPYLNLMSTPRACACGLCYDSSDDEYKFILIYKYFYVIYHVKRKYWTKKKSVYSKVRALDHMSRDYGQGISVDDELKELPRPEFIGAYESYRLARLKGCVGLYGGSRLYNCELDVWIMEHDGWSRIMKINCYNSVFIDEFLRNIVLLGCTRNGEIIFQARIMGLERLLMYDPERYKFLNPIGISGDFKLDVIPVFSESLYFPKFKLNIMQAQDKTTFDE